VARPLTARQVAALADNVRSMIEQIDTPNLDASNSMRHWIEGRLLHSEVVRAKHVSRFSATPLNLKASQGLIPGAMSVQIAG
jgi:hypothetical protein